jgi:hypothetical protein
MQRAQVLPCALLIKKQDAICVLFLFSLTTKHAQQEACSRILPATFVLKVHNPPPFGTAAELFKPHLFLNVHNPPPKGGGLAFY